MVWYWSLANCNSSFSHWYKCRKSLAFCNSSFLWNICSNLLADWQGDPVTDLERVTGDKAQLENTYNFGISPHNLFTPILGINNIILKPPNPF
jgi:hypothetical protein